MATSTIKKELLITDIPYSDFTWRSNYNLFESTNTITIPTGRTLVDIMILPDGFSGVLGGRYTPSTQKIIVTGLELPSMTPISGSYGFTCKLLFE